MFALGCGTPVPEPATPQTPNEMTAEEAKAELMKRGIHMSNKTLLQTVGRNDMEGLRLFVAAGMDINAKSEHGTTALSMAGGSADLQMAKYLLANAAKVDGGGMSPPISSAVERNNPAFIRLLLDNGAYIDLPDADGRTPLMNATRKGYTEAVSILVERGADLFAEDNRGNTARDLANLTKRKELAQMLYDAKGNN